MSTDLAALPTIHDTRKRVVSVLAAQSRLLRCCWNVLKVVKAGDAELSYRIATLMSSVGTALENLPRLAGDIMDHLADPDASSFDHLWRFRHECLDAHRLLSTVVVAADFHPATVAEVQFPISSIRDTWSDLCRQLAEGCGVEPAFGIAERRSPSAVDPRLLKVVASLGKGPGLLGYRMISDSRIADLQGVIVSSSRGSRTLFSQDIRRH